MLEPVGDPPLCACGCGTPLLASRRFRAELGIKRGDYRKYAPRHHFNVINATAKRAKLSGTGYCTLWKPNHPLAAKSGYIYEHVFVVDMVRNGLILPDRAEIHHVNGIKTDNRHQNLVVCEDHAFHMLLHVRAEARRVSGNPGMRRCWICEHWDDPQNMRRTHGSNNNYTHKECRTAYMKAKSLGWRLCA